MEWIIDVVFIFVTAVACIMAGDYRFSCYFLCALIVLFLVVRLFFSRKTAREIKDLIDYLEKVQNSLEMPALHSFKEGQLGILESELYKLVVLLKEQSNKDAAEKSYLSDMLSDISHQIKTPLTSITIMTDLLRDEQLPDEKRQEFVGKIETQVSKITWLVKNLLTISQLEAQVLRLKKDEVDLQHLLEASCTPIEALADFRDVRVTVLPLERDVFVTCDFNWTQEALTNIIKNCVEHTDEGGYVRISFRQDNLSTTIRIEDNGSGIKKEDLPHIFERFYKSQNSNTNSVGIGLFMAKQLFMRQNGSIQVESEEGKGTTFYIKMYRS